MFRFTPLSLTVIIKCLKMTKIPPLQVRQRESIEVPQECPARALPRAVISRSGGRTQEQIWTATDLEEESVKRMTYIYRHLSDQILVGPIMATSWSGLYFIITHVKANLPNLPLFIILLILGNCPRSDQNHVLLLLISSKAYNLAIHA